MHARTPHSATVLSGHLSRHATRQPNDSQIPTTQTHPPAEPPEKSPEDKDYTRSSADNRRRRGQGEGRVASPMGSTLVVGMDNTPDMGTQEGRDHTGSDAGNRGAANLSGQLAAGMMHVWRELLSVPLTLVLVSERVVPGACFFSLNVVLSHILRTALPDGLRLLCSILVGRGLLLDLHQPSRRCPTNTCS